MISTFKFTTSIRLLFPEAYKAQVFYIIAVFVKSLGLLGTSLLYLVFLSNKSRFIKTWVTYSVIPGGLPGYISCFSFCHIFYAWCCSFFEHIHESSFANNAYKIMKYVSYSVLGGFFICLLFMIFQDPEVFHTVEAFVAMIRDTVLGIVFIVFIFRIRFLLEGKQSLIMYYSSIFMVIGLFSRVFSVAIYTYRYSGKISEFQKEYYFVYILCFVFAETLPFIAIASQRMKCITDQIQESFAYIDTSLIINE